MSCGCMKISGILVRPESTRVFTPSLVLSNALAWFSLSEFRIVVAGVCVWSIWAGVVNVMMIEL